MNSKASKSNSPRTETIHLRLSPSQKALIDQAAKVQARSRSRFIVETACREAETVLLDQTDFIPGEDAFKLFAAMLEAPPNAIPGGLARSGLKRPGVK